MALEIPNPLNQLDNSILLDILGQLWYNKNKNLRREIQMEPSKKSSEMENFIDSILGTDRRGSIEGNVCTFCKNPAIYFRNEISEKEYSISGLCQKCQDDTFGKD
jgi:hypothetical protein